MRSHSRPDQQPTPCRVRLNGRHHQDGQALVLGLLLSMLGALALLRYFAVGQSVADKSRLLHTADAAAYSAAVVQSRALNMLSFLNRTQLAHQVAMAHLVTLGSWAMLGGTQATQRTKGNPPASLLASFFGAAHGQAYTAARSASGMDEWAHDSTGPLAQAWLEHETLVHDVLGTVQQEIVNGLPAARLQAMHHIVSSQYGDDRTRVEVLEDEWSRGLQPLPMQQMLPFVRALGSVHEGLALRHYTARSAGEIQARCPALGHELRRRGQTWLNDAGVWESIDTQSYHALRANRQIGCYFREYEMGWGWIPANRGQTLPVPYSESPPDNFSTQDFWRWVLANTDWDLIGGSENPLANSRAYVGRAQWTSRGLPVMMDTDHAAMGFQVRLQRTDDNRPREPMAQTFTAMSAAQSHFRRPQLRPDGLHEQANLFNPYWQARLMDTATPVQGIQNGRQP